MPIDVEKALAAELNPVEFSWTSSDVQLRHAQVALTLRLIQRVFGEPAAVVGILAISV